MDEPLLDYLTWIKLQMRAYDIQIAFGCGLCHRSELNARKIIKKSQRP